MANHFPLTICLTTLLGLTSCQTRGADAVLGTPMLFGVVDELRSEALDELRVLNVYLPPKYEASDKRYPVIYLLDGTAHEDYHHMTGLVQFLVMYELMPESIVVGIANVDRYRDFTHATKVAKDRERLPTGGGSARFIRFLEKELQPYIESKYRTGTERTIIGQSMGGLLATEILIDHPSLFDSYVIVSPSLWWDGGSLVTRAPDALRSHKEFAKRVFVTLGKEPPEMHAAADALAASLKLAPPPLRWGYETLREETHATVLHRGAYRAFEFLYGQTHKGL